MKLFKSGKDKALEALNEKRPLPLGMTEFEEWSDRIIQGSCLPASPESLKFALGSMLMHLGPTVDHEADGYFIKCLRKSAVNEIAHAKMEEIRTKVKARLAKEQEAKDEANKLTLVQNPGGDAGDGSASGTDSKTKPTA